MTATVLLAWCARIWPIRTMVLACAIMPVPDLILRTPDILAYPRDRTGWGKLYRLLTLGHRRARKGDCLLYLDDLLANPGGLELDRTSQFRSQRLVPLLQLLKEAVGDRVRIAATMLYGGSDRWRLSRLQGVARAGPVDSRQ